MTEKAKKETKKTTGGGMDERIKIQMENIADLCNCFHKTIVTPEGVIPGTVPDVSLQFYRLDSWKVFLQSDCEAVYFAKWQEDKLEKRFALLKASSPQEALNAFYAEAKNLIDGKYVCVRSRDIEKL